MKGSDFRKEALMRYNIRQYNNHPEFYVQVKLTHRPEFYLDTTENETISEFSRTENWNDITYICIGMSDLMTYQKKERRKLNAC